MHKIIKTYYVHFIKIYCSFCPFRGELFGNFSIVRDAKNPDILKEKKKDYIHTLQ